MTDKVTDEKQKNAHEEANSSEVSNGQPAAGASADNAPKADGKNDVADAKNDEVEEEQSSKLSNIIAFAFVIGLVAFNVYAFWGYKDYGLPEVSPDKPVPAQVDVSASADATGTVKQEGASDSAKQPDGSEKVPPQAAAPAQDPGAANGTGDNKDGKTAPPPPPANSGDAKAGNAKADKNAAPPPPGKRPDPIFATKTPGAADKAGDAKKDDLVAPPPGKRPSPIFATKTPGAAGSGENGKGDNSLVAPPPGKRPEPVFSKFNTPGSKESSGAVMMPGPQFLIGVSELCKDDKLGLTPEQRKKFADVLTLLAEDQSTIAASADNSLSYLTKEQVDWILANRGSAVAVDDVEPEAGFDPITTAFMRLLRSKKTDDGKKLTLTKHANAELTYQDIVNGILKAEKEKKELAISKAQAEALMPILVAANRARQNEAMHFQQLREILTDKQLAWLKEHPEKTVMNVNDVVLRYVRQVCE